MVELYPVIPVINYELRRTNRKTLCLEITENASVLVRAPLFTTKETIDKFVLAHEKWIQKSINKVTAKNLSRPRPSKEELAALKQKALEYIPKRVSQLSKQTGLVPASVKITSARTRFGSCSPKNGLCFSFLLMNYPEPAVDYVIIHELAHTVHHNHSAKFWALVEKHLPDYKRRKMMLK